MNIAPEIFKAYDIRGIVGKTLTPAVVNMVGQALGSLARERGCDTIAIGRDGRLSGPELCAALGDGTAQRARTSSTSAWSRRRSRISPRSICARAAASR